MLVHLDGADKYYGARRVLTQVTVTVRAGDKVGVVGPNGGGKSTLLRLLAGVEEPDGGRRESARGVGIGFLTQLVAFAPEQDGQLVEQYLRDALRDVDELAATVRALELELARPEVQADERALARTMDRYAMATARYEQAGGYEARARLRSTAFGLGFDEADLKKRVSTLSGGQKARLALARLLLSDADVLLLDEPTNHLDADTTEWLETFLQRAPQALVVVSHDRYFLDGVTKQTWDVDGGRVAAYPAPYSRAQGLKLEALARQQAVYERQQAEIERLQQFVDRYRAGIKARQARGRAAQLARMEPVEGPTRTARAGARGPRLQFAGTDITGRTGRHVLRTYGVVKGFGGGPVLDAVDVAVERGQRIGIVGPNGSGKTTLLRMLAGHLPPDAGRIEYGPGLHIGYFAQGHEDLDESQSIADHLLAQGDVTLADVRRHLARFLFYGDDIFAPVGQLSGGERNRVALARLILRRPNVLLLDEPTNHLDVTARQALEGALADFDGTIVTVSHDRYFLESLCQQLWIVDEGRVRVFHGPYSAWAQTRAEMRVVHPAAGQIPPVSGPASAEGRPNSSAREGEAAAHRERQQAERRQRQQRARRRQQLTARIADIEKEIAHLEEEQRRQETLLSDPALYADETRAKELVLAHQQTMAVLNERLAQWEALVEEEASL